MTDLPSSFSSHTSSFFLPTPSSTPSGTNTPLAPPALSSSASSSGPGGSLGGVGKSKRDPHVKALEGISAFLSSKSCYDILPESFRLIVFDNKLSITRSLQALVTNGVVSAPLYDSTTQRFAGMFTLADVVHLIQYYYLTAHEYENVIAEVEAFQLESLRKIEQAIDVPPPPTISVHPDQPLSDACAALVRTHARRLPLVDRDDQTGKETIVSVLTQYRVLKFIAINCQHDCAKLDQSIGSLGIGSYVSWYSPESTPFTSSKTSPNDSPASTDIPLPSTTPPTNLSAPSTGGSRDPASRMRSRSRSISREGGGSGTNSTTPTGTTFGVSDRYFPLATASMQTSVFDVVHIFSERGISAVPIVDEDGMVINMYETVDIVDLVRQNAYHILDKTIAVALEKRSSDFTGVITCTPRDTLASILAYIRERRCHRFVIIEEEDVEAEEGPRGRPRRKKGSLVGILSLSDVLRYLVGHENLKGVEVQGLGVHGLRGVGKLAGVTKAPIADTEGGIRGLEGVRPTTKSRRGSEGTDSGNGEHQASGSTISSSEGHGLDNVIEGQAVA